MERKHSGKLVEPISSDGGPEPQTLTKEQYAKLWAELAKKGLLLSADPTEKGKTGRNEFKTKWASKDGASGNN